MWTRMGSSLMPSLALIEWALSNMWRMWRPEHFKGDGDG